MKRSDGNRPIIEELHHLQLFRRFSDTDLKLMVDYLEEEHYEMEIGRASCRERV